MPAQPELSAIEKDKINIGFDFDFCALAQQPLSSIPANQLALFKWSGIYQQLQKGFFMMRIRIPGGLLSANQLERIADLAEQFAQDQICITTRQTLQFHWLRLEDLYKVLDSLNEVGLDTKNACGDVTRNVVTCPLQGVCPNEVGDIRSMIKAIADDPEIKDKQRNLPRKHKISVAGCNRACGQTLMNCQGWYPVLRGSGDTKKRGWCFYAGGGLGAKPFIAKTIFSWVPEDLVVEVAKAVVEVYRRLGDRRKRTLARIKIVVDRLGAKGFAKEVLAELRAREIRGIEEIEIAAEQIPIAESFLNGQSTIAQRQDGLHTVRVLIKRSEMTAEEARTLASLARKFGDSTVMLSARQNLLIRGVKTASCPALFNELNTHGFCTFGFEHLPDIVSCVGTTQCNLAVGDSPNAYHHLLNAFLADESFWQNVGPLQIHISGCPNSCAQHWIADLGLRGRRRESEVGSEEGFTIMLGGSLAGCGHIAQQLCDVPTSALVETLKVVLCIYLSKRKEIKESFSTFSRRVGIEWYQEQLKQLIFTSEPANIRNIRLSKVFKDVTEAVASEN